MKKKILKIALVTIVTICTTIGVKSAHKENESPLSLIFANVEALASSSEGGATGGHSLECGKGTIKLCKAKCGLEVETLFIDEGFGALDEESLEQACVVLQSLAGAKRMIGIISHVPELRERIEHQIVIEKKNFGSSVRVQV